MTDPALAALAARLAAAEADAARWKAAYARLATNRCRVFATVVATTPLLYGQRGRRRLHPAAQRRLCGALRERLRHAW